VSIKIGVRAISETVVGDAEIQRTKGRVFTIYGPDFEKKSFFFVKRPTRPPPVDKKLIFLEATLGTSLSVRRQRKGECHGEMVVLGRDQVD
jgi:hypothetical protein